MNEISNIHAFEDEDFLHACFVWGMAVLGAFAVCLVPVFMLLGGPADLDAADAGGWTTVFRAPMPFITATLRIAFGV